MASLHRTPASPFRTAAALKPPWRADGLQVHRLRRQLPDKFKALLPRAGTLSEEQRVQIFMAGLQPPLSLDVEIHNPQTLAFAMSLARKIELRDQCAVVTAPALPPPRHNQRGLLPASPARLELPAPPPQAAATAATPAPATVSVEGRTVKRLSQADMEDRCRLGLCFNCNEKFSRGHNRVCQRLFLLDLAAPDDDTDNDSLQEGIGETKPQVSLHAIAGVRFSDTMQVHINLDDAALLALFDSGSTHNFISTKAASRTKLELLPRGKMQVTVANGECIPCPGLYCNMAFTIGTETFATDFFALPLAGYDVLLGTQWLAYLGPILWDFRSLSMSFWRNDDRVCWHGMAAMTTTSLKAIASDDIMPALLDEFAAMFAEPTGMQPPSSRDHCITLILGSAPVAVRPYRYPVSHKDVLERQCSVMLTQGLIRRSTSAFSSPVLLVKKADGSWRFCIDYCALNAITIKDAYPIPVVDELLDELHGARFFTKLDLRSGYHQV